MFTGPERFEIVGGRPVRAGGELHVSDLQRVDEALAARDTELVRTCLGYVHIGYGMVLGLLTEWVGHWRAMLAERGLAEVVPRAQALLRATPGWEELGPPALEALHTDILAAVEAGPWDRADQVWADYQRDLRRHHDLLCWELWALPSAVGDEALALELNGLSLERCVGYGMLWEMARGLTPEELALTAAEHLRAHLSGVRVVEEEDRIRVILDACGSGGAMRRGAPGATPGYALVAEPSGLSWGRAGQVPSYCSHCALNERNSLKHLGRLAWVTEFDPDPSRPCGWTFFRSGDAPREFHERIGNNLVT